MDNTIQLKNNKINGNIWKFTVHTIMSRRAYAPFLTIFLLTMPSATARTIGLLTLIGQMVGFVFEIPSGYISDRIGHKKALVIARTTMVLSTVCYIFANEVWWFFAGAILLAIGLAFVSGTSAAFMHDTLVVLGKDAQYASIMGKIRSIGFAVPIIFIILLSTVAGLNFRIAFLIALLIDIIGLIAVILLKNPSIKKQTIKEIGPKNFFTVLKEFTTVGWMPFVIAESIVFGIVFGVTMGFRSPYQEMLGFSIAMIGILWAISRLCISSLLVANGWIYKRLSFKQFIVLRTLVFSVSFLCIGLVSNMWLVAMFFIFGNTAMCGLSSAGSQYHLEFIKKSSSKATLLSVIALMKKIFTAVVGLTMGLLVTRFYFQKTYLMVGIFLILVIFGIMVFVRKPKAI